MVSESEFSIDPATVGGRGGSLHVMNDGTVVHNLAIEDTDLTTADLAAGDGETLALVVARRRAPTRCSAPSPATAKRGWSRPSTVTEGGGAVAAGPPSRHVARRHGLRGQ